MRWRAWSSGTVVGAEQRPSGGPFCKNGDATGAARSTPRRRAQKQQRSHRAKRAYEERARVMGDCGRTKNRNARSASSVIHAQSARFRRDQKICGRGNSVTCSWMRSAAFARSPASAAERRLVSSWARLERREGLRRRDIHNRRIELDARPTTYGGTYGEYVERTGREAPGVHA